MAGSYEAVHDYSRAAFALGSARRRSRTQGMQLVPGPSAPIAGAVTPEGALAKVAHAIVAGNRNRDINEAENRQAMLEDARQAEIDQLTLEAKRKALDPKDLENDAYQREMGSRRAQAETATPDEQFDTPADLQPFLPDTPKLTIKQIEAYRKIHGMDERGNRPTPDEYEVIPGIGKVKREGTVWNAYKMQRAGLRSEPGSGRFDPRTEAEIRSESDAHTARDAALADAKTRHWATLSQDDKDALMLSGTIPQAIASDSTFSVADKAVGSTKANNVMRALRRAKNYDDLNSALSLTYSGDPIAKDENVTKERRVAVLKAAALATTRAQIENLFTATENPSDPLHADPEIRALLSRRHNELPE